jgi:hypothetical protein
MQTIFNQARQDQAQGDDEIRVKAIHQPPPVDQPQPFNYISDDKDYIGEVFGRAHGAGPRGGRHRGGVVEEASATEFFDPGMLLL